MEKQSQDSILKFITENPALVATLLAASNVQIPVHGKDKADGGHKKEGLLNMTSDSNDDEELFEVLDHDTTSLPSNESVESVIESRKSKPKYTAEELLSKRKRNQKSTEAQQIFCVSKLNTT